MVAKEIIKKCIPKSILPSVLKIYNKYYLQPAIAKKILSDYSSENVTDPELLEVLSYLKSEKKVDALPYYWAKYPPYSKLSKKYPVLHDETNMPYVIINDKKMFFPRDMSDKDVMRTVYDLDTVMVLKQSPHCYLIDDFQLDDNSIIADCGVAEGCFAFYNIEKIKKAYLFEPDLRWFEALKKTFEPWSDKVELIPKYLTDESGDNTICLDDFFKDREGPDFVKMDIEGYEYRALCGAINCLKSGKIKKAAICTYHKHNDLKELSEYLEKLNYNVMPSKGYMLFWFGSDFAYPYVRRGLIRIEKH